MVIATANSITLLRVPYQSSFHPRRCDVMGYTTFRLCGDVNFCQIPAPPPQSWKNGSPANDGSLRMHLRLPGLHNFRPLKFELDFWPSQLPFKHFRPCDRKRSLCLGSKMFENSKETWFWETFLNPVPTPYVSEIYQFSTSNLSLPQTHTHAIACFTAHAVVDPGTFLQQIGTLPSMPETNFGSSFWNQFFWTDGQFFQQNPH